MTAREIKLLELTPGSSPFEEWYLSLKEKVIRRRIFSAITKLAEPNYLNFKSVGLGVQELRIFAGAGYRVYFGMRGKTIVILLGGGDKSTQQEDIYEAQKLWKRFKDEISRSKRKFIS
jgi:putative addiction module killer protein